MNISNDVNVPVHISKGNMKLGRLFNISLIPIKDCGNSLYCRNKCYAMKAYRLYPDTRRASGNNSNSFRNKPEKAFDILAAWFADVKPSYFRVHTAGDMLSQSYLDGWIDIANENPYTKFNVMTKMFNLKYDDAPANMQARFSIWSGMDIPELKEGIVGYVWINDGIESRIPTNAFKCTGRCVNCFYCWNEKKDVVIKLH